MILAIIQARQNSTRFPDKVLANIYGKPVLQHCIESTKKIKGVDDIAIVTGCSTDNEDITRLGKDMNIPVYHGNETKLLYNYFDCAKKINADYTLRICADAPFFNPSYTEDLIYYANKEKLHYYAYWKMGDKLPTVALYPNGNYKEIISFGALNTMVFRAHTQYEMDNVTPYLYSHLNEFNVHKIYLDELDDTSPCINYPGDLRKVKRIARKYYGI